MFTRMSLRRSAILAVAAFGLFAPAMRADQITTFNVAGVLSDGATLSGDVVIDTFAGLVESSSLTVSSPLSFTVSFNYSGTGYNPNYFAYEISGQPDATTYYPYVVLYLPVTTLFNYAGGPLCSAANFGSTCTTLSLAGTSSTAQFGVTTGSLTTAPEPTSILLVGSALLGLLALRRRIER